MKELAYVMDDGGREAAGFKGSARDCVARAVAIASGKPYAEVYAELAKGRGTQRRSKRTGKKSASAREGINVGRKWFKDYMRALGFTWRPTMQVGAGCTVHLRTGEVPAYGRHVVMVSRHAVALVDGAVRDTHDPRRDGQRCVYGIWSLRITDAAELCKGRSPSGCEAEAEAAEEAGDYELAAAWWLAARYVTIGHNRSARYEEARVRCAELARAA